MERYSASITIHKVPMTLNEALRSHWGTYSKESESIHREIAFQLMRNKPGSPLKRVVVAIRRHSAGTLDRDNKFFTAKHVLDALVKIGIIENDTEAHVVSLKVDQVKIKRGEQKKLEVFIGEA